MKKSSCAEDSKITQLPLDRLLKEGESQRDRIVREVMEALFSALPDSTSRQYDFTLFDGTRCWIKKFYAPRENEEGELMYGFDVKFEEGNALAHLEFSVKCTGWERILSAPIE